MGKYVNLKNGTYLGYKFNSSKTDLDLKHPHFYSIERTDGKTTTQYEITDIMNDGVVVLTNGTGNIQWSLPGVKYDFMAMKAICFEAQAVVDLGNKTRGALAYAPVKCEYSNCTVLSRETRYNIKDEVNVTIARIKVPKSMKNVRKIIDFDGVKVEIDDKSLLILSDEFRNKPQVLKFDAVKFESNDVVIFRTDLGNVKIKIPSGV